MEIRATTYEKAPIPSTLLEAGLPLRKPSELDGGGGHGLLARKVDRSLPVLVSKVSVDFEVLANALNHLKVDVVQSSAAGGRARGSARGGAGASRAPVRDGRSEERAGDEVFGGLLIAYPKLDPFIAAQVISNP